MFKELVTDVFFDLDHTLWDFEKNSALTFSKILSESEVGVDLDDFLKAYIPINLTFWKWYREGKINKEELRFQRLKTTFDSLKYGAGDELIHSLADKYIEHLSTFNHLFPNALDVLDYLRPNYKLHIITNGFQEIQDKKLRNANIDHFFDQIINSEMAGVKKPDPLIFQLALERAKTLPHKSIMIGDSVEADIIGAKAVGLHVLHFNAHQEPKHNYCQIIHDLSEIKSFL
ncbi:Pyrimidine 5'-nucleotidase YjjG [Arenibacter antarcticus]|uniref:YjjG family noncanonical pyrimidine nucleotidase n=1 Tax=Arenibacter antarcticus TaxID=2040469 RepID=A0ABW5VCG9_9FLAO|nr:YjjG family noncanonical pyrimidine nucleotidase [Arenibacter sp. H213]MCM4168492.1 noncanonical pyrimidine nucleotidase, YjjG family [Arenibacter sp. H213]